MFSLKIHTIDFSQPLHVTFTSTTSDGSAANTNNNLKPVELKGAAHLFRQLPSATHTAVTVASISAHTTLVFVVAVPNYLSENDFLVFCGNHVRYFEEVIFLKNDGMEDRYSVLIRLESQLAADGFLWWLQRQKIQAAWRLSFAIYILLNPLSTPTLQKLLVHLLL
ncbi:hypothetical protein OROHE_024861, partial [Orobanche hederae]